MLECIAARARYPITLILAPAGCGKSVALDQYLDESRLPYVRFNVQRDHDTLPGFLRGLANAVKAISPGAPASVGDALKGALRAERPPRDLAQWMHAHLGDFPGIVAIDDFHHAEGDAAVTAFLQELVARTKSHTKWIFASRSARPPVSSWVVYGDADVPIQEDVLKFTFDEATDAARLCDAALNDEEISQLLDASSGWAAALGLSLRASSHAPDTERATLVAREISFEYLTDHVWSSLTPEQRDLLMFSSLLPEFDGETLELAGFPHAVHELRVLHERAAFLMPDTSAMTAGRRNVYRCHDLFRDFIEREFSLLGDARCTEICRRAAAIVEMRYGAAQALRLYLRARSSDDVLRILEHHGFDLIDEAHEELIDEAVSALPEHLAEHAAVLALRGERRINAGDYSHATALLQKAIERAQTPELRALAVGRLSVARYNLGEPAGELLRATALDTNLSPDTRCELQSYLALSNSRYSADEELPNFISSVEALADTVRSPRLRARIYQRTGMARFYSGDIDGALRSLQRSAIFAEECNWPKAIALAYRLLTTCLSLSGDFERARECTAKAAHAANRCGWSHLIRHALLINAEMLVFEGNEHDAREAIQRYEQFPAAHHPYHEGAVAGLNSWLAAWRGSFGQAYDLIEQWNPESKAYWEEDTILYQGLAAIYAAAAGRRTETAHAIARTLQHCRDMKNVRVTVARMRDIGNFFCALAESLNGRTAAALRLLTRPPETDAPLVLAVRECVTHLVRSDARGISTADAEPHLEAMRSCGYGGFARIFQSLIGALQEREQKASLTAAQRTVFTALASGASPKEAAAEMGCSVYTVRAHIRAVIKKFGCSGSDQAIRIAKARSLI